MNCTCFKHAACNDLWTNLDQKFLERCCSPGRGSQTTSGTPAKPWVQCHRPLLSWNRRPVGLDINLVSRCPQRSKRVEQTLKKPWRKRNMGIKGRRCPTPNGKSEDRPEHSPAVHPALDKCKLAHSTSPFCPWVGQQWTAKIKSLGRKNLLRFVSFAVRTSKSWQVLANSNHRASSNYSTYLTKKTEQLQGAKQCR